MDKREYKAVIKWHVKDTHPDYKECKLDTEEEYSFDDTYIIDMGYFYGEDDVISYIKRDLALVAGGGYDTEHITGVEYNINRVK